MATFTFLNNTPTGSFDNTTVSRGISVAGLNGSVTGVSMTMIGLTQSFVSDLDVLLVGPGGQNLMVMSDLMGGLNSAYSNVTFSDTGSTILPVTGNAGLDLETGTYRPFTINNFETLAAFGLPDGAVNHATGDGVVSFASMFNTTNPNGLWTLYVEDDANGDVTSMAAWSLTVSTSSGIAELRGTASDNTITITSTSVTDGSYLISGGTNVEFTGVIGFDLYGLGGNDVLRGGDGSDYIYGGAGRDIIQGGVRNDSLFINDGDLVAGEIYDGGADVDRLYIDVTSPQILDFRSVSLRSIEAVNLAGSIGSGTMTLQMLASQIGNGNIDSTAIFTGRNGNTDILQFTMASFNLLNLGGLQFLGFGDAGDQIVINGDSSNETVTGSRVNDTINGDGGIDTLAGGAGNDTINGGSGADTIYGGAGAIDATETGNDILSGGDDMDNVYGNGGNDTITGGFGEDFLIGGTGDDIIYGGLNASDTTDASNDFMRGGDGTDTLYGNNGNDTLSGGAGADTIYGGEGIDLIYGGALLVDATDIGDIIRGGNGNDDIRGNGGADMLYGEADNDVMRGGIGDDYIFGGLGNDFLFGGEGDDFIYGGLGNDYLLGGLGADHFIFDTTLNDTTNVDSIDNFTVNVDDIYLLQGIFTGIGATLDASEFRLGSFADAATDRIIYDQGSGKLFYDSNGDLDGGSTLFAQLNPLTALTLNDFVMYL